MRKHDILLVSEDKEKTKKEANFYNGSLSFGIIVFRMVVKKISFLWKNTIAFEIFYLFK